MNEYNGSKLFGRHYTSNVYCGGQTSDHVIHMRRLGLSSCATVRDKKRTTKSVESSLLLFQNKHYL